MNIEDAICAHCGGAISRQLDMNADDYDEDQQGTQCQEGCGERFHLVCYGKHYQDCFDDHARAAALELPRRYAP